MDVNQSFPWFSTRTDREGSLLAEVSHDEAKMRERRETEQLRAELSSKEKLLTIQNGGCFQFLFRNKLRHDITAIVKGYLCVCQILDFIKHLTINY